MSEDTKSILDEIGKFHLEPRGLIELQVSIDHDKL